MSIVKARSGVRYSDKDAAVIKSYLDKKFPSGVFKTKDVVDTARSSKSEIHRYFDWNDSSAAEKYRLVQARGLITCFVIMIEDQPIQEYIHFTDKSGGSYIRTEQAVQDSDIWDSILSAAKNDLKTFQLRYKKLALIPEMVPVFNAISEVIDEEEKHSADNRRRDQHPAVETKASNHNN